MKIADVEVTTLAFLFPDPFHPAWCLGLTQKPGIGVEVNEEAVERYRV